MRSERELSFCVKKSPMSTATLPDLIDELREVVGLDGVLSAHSDLVVYECDGFVIEKNSPDVVVFPRTTQQVSEIVRLANKHRVPFVPRGAGTSLAGGCLPVGGGIMIVLTRMKAIEEINLRDRYAVVQPGVVNAWLNQALKGTGFHYAARSVEPGGLHDRRKRRHQQRRPAYAEIRRDG